MTKKSSTPAIRFKGFSDTWEQRKLGDMMNVTSVKRIHQSDWTDSGVRFLRARDIVAAAKNEEPDDYLYISKEKYEEYSVLSGKVGVSDLLVTGVGTIGVPYLVRNLEPLYFKDGNIIWFQNSGKIDGKFLFYSFSAEQIQGFIKESAGIGTVGTYTIESGKKTPISLPNQIEQARVGEFFTSLDNLITLHQRKYDKLTNVKKSMLEKMFPKNGSNVPEIRFKGFTEAWEQRKVSDLAEKTYGGGTPTTSNEAYWNGDIPWIQSSDVVDGKLLGVEPRKWITQDGLNNSAAQLIPENSIAIITRVGVGKLAFMPYSYATSQDFLSLSKLNAEPLFTVYACYKKLQSELNAVQGTSIKGITKDELLAKNIMVPRYAEQQQIGAFFKQLDNLITLHQRELEKLKNLKKACLEKMFV